jgi:hypothetical protein
MTDTSRKRELLSSLECLVWEGIKASKFMVNPEKSYNVQQNWCNHTFGSGFKPLC